MTKKDYELIARVFAGLPAKVSRHRAVIEMGIALATDNPRFDGWKFYDACCKSGNRNEPT